MPNPSRRAITQGAAWSIPAITVAAAAPAVAASPVPAPVINVTTLVKGWTDDFPYEGYIAQGVSVQVTDAKGNPIPNAPVTLTITNFAGNQNTFWFVTDRTASSKTARTGTHLQTITLTTDTSGRVSLDNGGTGYLRHGTDGENNGSFFTVASGATTTRFTLYNSSLAGYKDGGVRPTTG